MKRYFLAIGAALLLLASCQKDDTALFCGNYSFKTSGWLTAVRDSVDRFDTTFVNRTRRDTLGMRYDTVWADTVPHYIISRIDTSYVTEWNTYTDTVVTEYPETLTLSLSPESGQMDITEVDAKAGDVVVTMNITGGDLLVYYAHSDGSLLTLEPTRRMLHSSEIQLPDVPLEELNTLNADVTVTGSAHRYSNILLFDLDYAGAFTYGGIHYNITGSEVNCRAKQNE